MPFPFSQLHLTRRQSESSWNLLNPFIIPFVGAQTLVGPLRGPCLRPLEGDCFSGQRSARVHHPRRPCTRALCEHGGAEGPVAHVAQQHVPEDPPCGGGGRGRLQGPAEAAGLSLCEMVRLQGPVGRSFWQSFPELLGNSRPHLIPATSKKMDFG